MVFFGVGVNYGIIICVIWSGVKVYILWCDDIDNDWNIMGIVCFIINFFF